MQRNSISINMRHARSSIYWVDFSQNVKSPLRVERFRTASGRRKEQIKVELSPWISITLKMPVVSDDHKEAVREKRYTSHSAKRARASSRKLLTACRLAAECEQALWGSDGFDGGRSARRGRLKGIAPSRRLRKVCKADVGSRMFHGRDVPSIVRIRWGLRPLTTRSLFLIICNTRTYTSSGKYNINIVSLLFLSIKFSVLSMNPLTNLKLIFP